MSLLAKCPQCQCLHFSFLQISKAAYDLALRRFRSSPASRDVEFTIKYFPFQLYPEASKEGEDKYEWYGLYLPIYSFIDHPILFLLLFPTVSSNLSLTRQPRYKKEKYNNSEEQMQKYTTLMTAYGVGSGIDFDFHGTIANTMDAHRLIQHYQESLGLEAANKIVNCLPSPSARSLAIYPN